MNRNEWFLEDTVALKKIAIYYGIPKYGHTQCYRDAGGLFLVEQVNRSEPDIEKKHCSACGNLLIQRNEKRMEETIGKTHEWRKLEAFQEGDTIHRWGDDLPVVSVESLPDGHVRLMYHDTDNVKKMIDNRKSAEYIARKREVTQESGE